MAFNPESLSSPSLAIGIVVLVSTLWYFRSKRPTPPLPTHWQHIDTPPLQSQNWLTFARWAYVYGTSRPQCSPLSTMSKRRWKTGELCLVAVLGQTIIILNSAKVANAMLAAKIAIYSERQSTSAVLSSTMSALITLLTDSIGPGREPRRVESGYERVDV